MQAMLARSATRTLPAALGSGIGPEHNLVMSPVQAPEWPLVGRASALATIDSALRSGVGVVLAGPAGVGKTRLARAALMGRRVRWVLASSSARGVPLAAFVPLLDTEVAVVDATALLMRVHVLLRSWQHDILAVDDAHQLDDVSASVLHQTAGEDRVRMLVTVRTAEPAPDAVTALWKDGLLTRVDLAPLSELQTAELVNGVLGGRLEGDSTRRLHQLTGGNPLWLRHLVEAGPFRGTAGIWRWDGAPQLGSALMTLLGRELDHIPPEILDVLELLAVGEPLGLPLLSVLSDSAALEDATSRGLVAIADGQARLAHPLYGEAALSRAGPLRARRRRGELVDALLAAEPEGGDVLRLAVLALDSDRPPDSKLLAAAARIAAGFADIPLAARLGRAACAAGAGFETRLMLAVLLAWQYSSDAADEHFIQVECEAATEDDRLRLAFARWAHYVIIGRVFDGDAVLTAMAAESTRSARNVLAARALDLVHSGRLEESATMVREVLAAPDVMMQARGFAAWAGTAVAALAGRADEAADSASLALDAMAQAPETVSFQSNIRFWAANGLAWTGRIEELERYLDQVDATLSGSSMRAIFMPVLRGTLALVTGQIDMATTLLAEFRARVPGHGGGLTCFLEPRLAIARAMAGDAAGAAESLQRARTLRHPIVRVHEPQLALAQAWATAATGAVTAAVGEARRAAAAARAERQYAVEMMARHAAVGFGDKGQANALALLARRVDGPWATGASAHAQAWAAADVPALLDAAKQMETAGLLLHAAEAAGQAAVLIAPKHPNAPGVRSRAAALAARCPSARTPAILAAARPLPISPREREIAVLARTMTNREVAQQLGLSVRTVEGHVYRSYTRLGLPNRAALVAYVIGA